LKKKKSFKPSIFTRDVDSHRAVCLMWTDIWTCSHDQLL